MIGNIAVRSVAFDMSDMTASSARQRGRAEVVCEQSENELGANVGRKGGCHDPDHERHCSRHVYWIPANHLRDWVCGESTKAEVDKLETSSQ